MGSCVCLHSKKFVIDYPNKKENTLKFQIKNLYVESCLNKNYKQNYFNKITKNNWVRILNFLKFKELKEASKVNSVLYSLAKSQNILMKFFENKSNNLKFRREILTSQKKFDPPFKNIVSENQNIFQYKLETSTFNEFQFKKHEIDEEDSISDQLIEKQLKGYISSFKSDLEESKHERELNNLDYNSETRIKILNSHNLTILSVPSDQRTSSFALESGLDSFLEKTSKHGNKKIFRSFGSHNTKISQIFNEHQNEILIPNFKEIKLKTTHNESSPKIEKIHSQIHSLT